MNNSTPDFSLKVDGVEGICPAGEKHAQDRMAEGKIPVFSCEGPCIRGEIARLAANIVAKESGYARSCYAETFLVPHSSMKRWLMGADKVVMIDGCFLKCLGRILKNIVDEEKMIHIDTCLYTRNLVMHSCIPMSRRLNGPKLHRRLPIRF